MAAFVGELMKTARVMAPVRRDGVGYFEWLESADQLDATCVVPRSSPKAALLPRCETLFGWRLEKGEQRIVPPPEPIPQILFGLHPCDVRAIATLDAVFASDPSPDRLYLARRAVTTVIGRGSLADPATAFFRELGVDPMDNGGCDLFLAPLDPDRHVLEIISDKGRALLPACERFPKADDRALALLADLRKSSAAKTEANPGLEQLAAKLAGMFESDLWSRIHEHCAGCGVCAFLCPTCHCFDIQEEQRGDRGARVRVWDTCQFGLFTRHASGHNPRTSQKERLRQRIMHKFSYGIEKFKVPFCVGCGRCVGCCPANNDLRAILRTIRETPSE